jgi:hypothetical protein
MEIALSAEILGCGMVRRTKEQPDAGCYRAVFGCYEMQSHERITYHQSQKPNFAS